MNSRIGRQAAVYGIALLVAQMLALNAIADTFSKSTYAGLPVVLGSHSTVSIRCFSKPANIFVVSPPAGGRISIGRGSRAVVETFGDRVSSRCAGQKAEISIVTYTPRRGFVGNDQVTYRVQYASENTNPVKDFTFAIRVVPLPRDLRERGWYPPAR